MAKINLIRPAYIGEMEKADRGTLKLYNIGRRTFAESTIKKMGFLTKGHTYSPRMGDNCYRTKQT